MIFVRLRFVIHQGEQERVLFWAALVANVTVNKVQMMNVHKVHVLQSLKDMFALASCSQLCIWPNLCQCYIQLTSKSQCNEHFKSRSRTMIIKPTYINMHPSRLWWAAESRVERSILLWGNVSSQLHLISPGCPRPNSALIVHKSGLKTRSSIHHVCDHSDTWNFASKQLSRQSVLKVTNAQCKSRLLTMTVKVTYTPYFHHMLRL